MGKKDDTAHRTRYTLEFKLEAVRLVKVGQDLCDSQGAGHAQADAWQLDTAVARVKPVVASAGS